MGHEGQYKPQPQQGGIPEQQPQPYYGWQYEQDLFEQPAALESLAPAVPPQVSPSVSGILPAFPPSPVSATPPQALPPVSGIFPAFPPSPAPATPAQALPPISGILPAFPSPPAPATPAQALPPVPGALPATPAQTQFRSLRSYGMPSGPLPASSGPLSAPSGPLVSPQSGVPQSWPAQYQTLSQQQQEAALPEQYQEPLLDMGSSLGYGQGMGVPIF